MIKVNIGVCGRFHYHNYIKYLNEYKVLNRFYYSHRIQKCSKDKTLQKKFVNIWIKEYLLRLHLKIFNRHFQEYLFPLYHDLWEFLVLKRWVECDIFHVLLHGTARRLIKRAKYDNTVILGEPVNIHPEDFNTLIQEEYHRLGIEKKIRLDISQKRIIEEVKMCDFLLVASNFLKKSFFNRGYPKEKIYVLPYGVNLDNFYPLNSENKNQKFRVICVAHLSPRKGHIYLLEAWKKLNLPNAELVFIGGYSYEMLPILKKYSDYFTYVRPVGPAKLNQYYNSADIFVLPSIEDGFGVVCTEAMATGLPIIITQNTGAADIIQHGKEGFIVPIRSPESLAYYIELLYKDKDKREYMGRCALEKAKKLFNWKNYAQQLVNIYKSIHR